MREGRPSLEHQIYPGKSATLTSLLSKPCRHISTQQNLADEQTWGDWAWEIYGVVAGAVVDKSPMEGLVPLTKSDGEYTLNTQEGGILWTQAHQANKFIGTNMEEYVRIKGLSRADYIKEFTAVHTEAAAKPAPKPSPTPAVSDPMSWRTTQAERDAINKSLENSGGVPGYN